MQQIKVSAMAQALPGGMAAKFFLERDPAAAAAAASTSAAAAVAVAAAAAAAAASASAPAAAAPAPAPASTARPAVARIAASKAASKQSTARLNFTIKGYGFSLDMGSIETPRVWATVRQWCSTAGDHGQCRHYLRLTPYPLSC